MAQIWQQLNSQGWAPTSIKGVVVFALPPVPELPSGQDARQPEPGQALLRRSTGRNPREDSWVLFTPATAPVSVNGSPMLLGQPEKLMGVVRVVELVERIEHQHAAAIGGHLRKEVAQLVQLAHVLLDLLTETERLLQLRAKAH
jgi:hypothetical protein